MEDELVNRSAALDATLSLESPGEAREDAVSRAHARTEGSGARGLPQLLELPPDRRDALRNRREQMSSPEERRRAIECLRS